MSLYSHMKLSFFYSNFLTCTTMRETMLCCSNPTTQTQIMREIIRTTFPPSAIIWNFKFGILYDIFLNISGHTSGHTANVVFLTSKWVLGTTLAWHIVFWPFPSFLFLCTVLASFCFILMQKEGKKLRGNVTPKCWFTSKWWLNAQ